MYKYTHAHTNFYIYRGYVLTRTHTQTRLPSKTSSSCCPHCVLTRTQICSPYWIKWQVVSIEFHVQHFQGKILHHFNVFIHIMWPTSHLQLYLLMQWGWLMKAVDLKKRFSTSVRSLWVSMTQLASLILCWTVCERALFHTRLYEVSLIPSYTFSHNAVNSAPQANFNT